MDEVEEEVVVGEEAMEAAWVDEAAEVVAVWEDAGGEEDEVVEGAGGDSNPTCRISRG